MIQDRSGAGFALEAVDGLGVAREIGGEELNGDQPSESRIAGAVDLTRPILDVRP